MKAVYTGDNSYTGSSATPALVTITPAQTAIIGPSINGPIAVGFVLASQVTVKSQGSGAPPGGTVTFFANGAPVNGTVTYSPASGAATGSPYLQANFLSSSSPFTKPGTYTISASYRGDENYGSSNATAASVTVKYPPPAVAVQSSGYTIPAGTNLTLTGTVFSSSTTVAPTGTIAFYSMTYGLLPGTPNYSTVTGQDGNLDLQAALPFTINASDNFSVVYSGDTNYPGGSGGSGVVTVTGSDFNFTFPQNSLTVTRGQNNGLTLLVGMQANAVPVTFSATPCAGLPAESTCNVSPSSLTYTGTVQLSVATTVPHSAQQKRMAEARHLGWWISAEGMSVGIFLLGIPIRKPRRRLVLSLIILGLLSVGVGCGGGSSNGVSTGAAGGGGTVQTDPGTPVGTYTITVTGTSGTLSHTATFTLVVQ